MKSHRNEHEWARKIKNTLQSIVLRFGEHQVNPFKVNNRQGSVGISECKFPLIVLLASPDVKAAQVLSCGHLEIFKETLEKARPESNVLIIACLSSILADADAPDTSTTQQRIDPVLQDVREVLDLLCEAKPEVQFMVSPPMYRSSPVWYREGLPEVLTSFSHVLTRDKPSKRCWNITSWSCHKRKLCKWG